MAKTKSPVKKPKSLRKSTVKNNPIIKAKKIGLSKKASLSLKKKQSKKSNSKLVGRPRNKVGENKGVVYLSHIPHGFYEDQIEGYFNQFGKVTAVSVPRSKSGRSKGYAFIEFKHSEVAQIAAETMNNYLMFNRVLKAKCIPAEEQKPMKFQLAESARLNKETLADKTAKRVIQNRKFKNRNLKSEIEARKTAILIWKEKRARNAIKKLGIEYDFEVQRDGVESVFEKRNKLREKKKEKALLENTAVINEEDPSSDDDEELSSFDGDISLSDEEFSSITSDVEEKSSTSENLKKKIKISNISNLVEGQTKKNLSSKKINKQNKVKHNVPSIIEMSEKHKTPLKTPILKHQSDKNIQPKQTSSTPIASKTKKENDNPTKVKSKTPQTDVAALPASNKTPVSKLLGKSKSSKNTPSTPKLKDIKDLVMEVDENDAEINFKTPPNVLKKFIKGNKQSAKTTPKHKENSNVDTPNSIASPGKTLSAKKPRHRKSVSLLQEVKTPTVKTPKTPAQISPSPGESTSSKKPRHRQLKRLSTTK